MHMHNLSGEQLRILLKVKKLTQQDVADRVNISRNTVVNYLRTEQVPNDFVQSLLNAQVLSEGDLLAYRSDAGELQSLPEPDLKDRYIATLEERIRVQDELINVLLTKIPGGATLPPG